MKLPKILKYYSSFRSQHRKFSSTLLNRNLKRETFLEKISAGPGLQEFLNVKPSNALTRQSEVNEVFIPYLSVDNYNGQGRKVYFEVYGCQMNTNDTEVVWSILQTHGYDKCKDIKDADVIMVITCAIRERAEIKIWNRLQHLKALKNKRSIKRGPLQISILGCMAERLKQYVLEKEKCVDVVAGPDSYKDLPRLLALTRHYEHSAVNVLLSLDETYADVMPVRLNSESPTAFISIMRGCDNMCSYCIVPFTRGRERSRPLESIVNEVKVLANQGVQEVTLLGQNVNSYRDLSKDTVKKSTTVPGFKTVYKNKVNGLSFALLLQQVAETVPNMRIRFTSPHPKDFSEDVLRVIRDYPNICKNIHLPAQSGNNSVLERMRRGYTREAYLKLVDVIREFLPHVGLSSDFICGFCGETEAEFNDTVTLIEKVRYNMAYLFAYSMREKTSAYRNYKDDVPQLTKMERLQRMVEAFRKSAEELHKEFIGERELILIEGKSKRSDNYVFGRNEANIKVIVPLKNILINQSSIQQLEEIKIGDFVAVHVTESNSQVLKAEPLYKTSIQDFYSDK
uniref:CDK5RAP1-like protein n=1 Tax=Glossina brevipalpis TaxID=37001 RepID=A0A1A9WB31_9MUSC